MRKLNKHLAVLVVIIIAAMAVPALANVPAYEEENYIVNVNEHILREVEKAETLALDAYAVGDYALVEEIMSAVAAKALNLTENAIAWAERQDLTVECYDIEVLIGDTIYYIDPIHILW